MSNLKHNLVQYLKEFVVDERRELFEEKIQQRTKHITVVLENIFQGRNISASIRSADCFGVQDVHVIENDNIFNDDSEVSMGADKWVSTTIYNQEEDNTAKAIKKLKDEGNYVVADFICPTPEARSLFPADYIIWVDTIKEGRFDDTNKMFVKPDKFDFLVATQDAKKWAPIILKEIN